MRTAFVVGIFGLTAAIVGGAEWASQRAVGTAGDRPALDQTAGKAAAAPADTASSGASTRPNPTPEPAGVAPSVEAAVPTLVLSESQGGFRLNAVTLSPDAAARIDEFVAGLDPEMVDAHFVIEGHTDNLGSKDVNQAIGLARALAVRQYLAESYAVPKNLMRVASYGSDQPVADNATPEGRSMNRRVVIKVIESSK